MEEEEGDKCSFIIISPDQLPPVAIFWSGMKPTKTKACFDPNNTSPTARLTVRCYHAQISKSNVLFIKAGDKLEV